MAKIITADDVVRSGGCASEVHAFVEKHGIAVIDAESDLSNLSKRDIGYILNATKLDGYGYG